MEDVGPIVTLFLALGVADIGRLIARRFGLSVMVGYIVTGIVIGSNSPGLAADGGRVPFSPGW